MKSRGGGFFPFREYFLEGLAKIPLTPYNNEGGKRGFFRRIISWSNLNGSLTNVKFKLLPKNVSLLRNINITQYEKHPDLVQPWGENCECCCTKYSEN